MEGRGGQEVNLDTEDILILNVFHSHFVQPTKTAEVRIARVR
jgi:hypothetical protein